MVIESISFGPLVTRQKTYGVTATLQKISEEWDGKDDQGNYLPDGNYKITLIATDLAGNRSQPLTIPAFIIDRTPSAPTTLYVDNLIFTPDDGPSNQGDGDRDSVTLHYILSEEALVSVRVEDVLGRTILNLGEASDFRTEGAHLWDGKVNGNFVSDGSYVFRIKTTDDVGNIAYGSRAVIKNGIPAQIVFPSRDEVPSKVSGLVSIKGIALDPGINNPANFKWYKVWYREGKNIDFSLPENDPLNPDSGLWHPVPVPAYNQNALDPEYPNSNVSWRAVAYTTLATWDTTGLTSGSYYTLLLVTEDEEGNSSYDFVTVEVDPTVDDTLPQISITHPSDLTEFRIVSDTSTLSIVYDLAQNSGKQADVSFVIFKMSDDGSDYGPIVYHRDYLSRSEGGTLWWDGKDNLRRYVENGRYRIRLTARDSDGLGGTVAQVDITVKVIVTEPLKIVKFAASDSVINVGGSVEISCELSKDASVTVAIYDASDNLVETLVDSVVTPGEVEQRVNWTSQLEGLYTCRIIAIATDADKTRDEASLSIAVTGAGAGTGVAEINYPQEGAIVKGEANYNWQASAQGEHYPPQVFSATAAARGKEWLGPYDWIQSTNFDFNSGTENNVVVANNEVKLTFVSDSKFVELEQILSWNDSRWYIYWYQTFIPRINVRLNKIKLFFNNRDPKPVASTVTIQVRKVISSSGNSLEVGNVLGEKSLYISLPGLFDGGGAPHPFTFSFDSPIDLYKNQVYCFRLSFPGDMTGFMYSTEDPYPDGRVYAYNHFINKWYDWSGLPWGDFIFELIGDYYEPYGYIISSEFDTGPDTTIWEKFNVRQELPSGTKITYETFSYDASGTPWDASRAVPALPGEMIKSPSKRYVRWKANFSTSEPSHSPVLKEVKVSFIKEKDWKFAKTFEGSSYYCWYGHPLYVPEGSDLSVFFPELEGKNVTSGPFYSILSETNPQVAKSITNENGYYQLKATTDVKEDWDTAKDPGLNDGGIVSINNEFNNSLNPEDFILESSPITISTGYPNVNMWVADEVKNKYTFWRNAEGSLIDNPYVSVNTKSWDIQRSYPDGTKNIDLVVNKQSDKPSNTNSTALDDDFTVKLSSNAAPKVFVELEGNTSTLAQGFKGYSMFYKKQDEITWKSIPSASKLPVTNNGMLGWWNVTGLNGEYVVKLVVLDDSGTKEVVKNVIIGTKVPGAEATASPPNYVTSPYNKAFLSFPPDALERDTIVTITPVRLEDTGVSIDPNIPHPIGAFYKLQPKDIAFTKDSEGNVLYPASFSVRFTYEELQGVDPGQLTIYHIKDDGSLESLDVKVVYDENGNGQFDPEEIATVTSPITSFSYYLVIPKILTPVLNRIPSPTNQKSVTVTGQAENASSVEVFVNGASVGNVDVDGDGKFSMPVSLVTGSNRITSIATRWFNNVKTMSSPSVPVEVILDVTPPEITDVYDSPDPFTPNGDGIRDSAKIFYTLSEGSIVELKIYKDETLVRTLVGSLKIAAGPHSEVWDGKDDEGSMVGEGIYTYRIDGTDLAGNSASQQEGQLEVSYQTMPPPAPIPIAPPDGEYINTTTPTFQICPDETVERQLSYSIEISTDDFKTVFRRYDQTVSTQGWTLAGEIIQYTIDQEDGLGDAIYKWRAFSYDDFNWSEPSIVWTFKLDMEPPPKPKLLFPEDGASVRSPRPTFDWENVVDTVSGLDCYEIQVDNNRDFGSPEYIAIVIASNAIPQSDLAQSEYYWRVRARDKLDHYSDWTDPWRFTRTNSPPAVPTLMSPEKGKFIVTELPSFQIFTADPDNDPLKCKIEISTDNFNTIERCYDQNISTAGWKVAEVPSSPKGMIFEYTIQPGDKLAEGIYYWRGSAYDGTLWSNNSTIWNFTLDMSSPTISVSSPVKGEVYNARQRMISIEFAVTDLDSSPTVDGYLQKADSGRIAVSSGEMIEPLDIDEGLWNLIVQSTDWAGNVSSMVAGPFEVTHDIRPPRTSIVVGEPKYGQEPVYVASDTQFTLSVVDDYLTIEDGKGLGLSLTEYSIDGDKWTTYTGTFTVTLGEAPHTVYYRSIDKGGLREETKSLDIVIDNKVPQIILIAEGNLSTNGIDNFASLSCEYRLAVIGDSSWVDHSQFKVDNAGWQTYTAPFSFDVAGEHIIKYRIVSKTGNPEKENVFKVVVDSTPPQTTLNPSSPLYNGLYASPSTVYSMSGIDPLVDGKASGVAEIKYRTDEEEFKTYLKNFPLAGGEHTIHYYGRDNVNNVEEVDSFKVFVDTISPQTTLTPSESYSDGENIFAPITCTYSLVSSQPLSGVNHIEFSLDNGDWNIYNSTISLSTEGQHSIKYKAVSNTGVWEKEKEFKVIVDAKGPKVASVYPENGAYVRAPDIEAIKICFAEPIKIGNDKWEKSMFISQVKNGAFVSGEITYDDAEYTLTFKGKFEDHTPYNIKLTSEIKDRVGNPLKELSSSFTTLMLKEKGGKVEEGEVSLEIPPDGLPQDAVIIISKEQDEIVNKIPRPFQSFEKDTLYHIVAYNQEHQEIQQKLKTPMGMKISYAKEIKSQTKDTSKVEINSIDPKTLKLYWYNPEKQRWELVENSKNDFSVKEVIAQVERFGRYCLMGFIPFGDSLEGLSNYPNPFPAFGKDYTTIQYYLKDDADVAIAIYDLMGNLVKVFEKKKGEEGGRGGDLNRVEWDGRNGRGDRVANGGYICRVQIDDGKRVKSKTRKILVIK
jgi:flagellar hook assembly protein FlgD